MVRKVALRLSENDVERQITDYLAYHGWYVIRLHAGTAKLEDGHKIRLGEKGRADWLALRSFEIGKPIYGPGWCQAIFVEVKRPGGKLALMQRLWIQGRREEGFLAETVDSYERFLELYRLHFGGDRCVRAT